MANQKHTKARLVFTGFSMGMADLVPGVSGGTIALLYGIYDELLFSIKTVTGQVPRLLLAGKWREAIAATPFSFLVPLFVGIFGAVFSMVNLFSYLLEHYPTFVWSVFFGLVLGSAYVISKRLRKGWNRNRIVLFGIAFAVTFWLVGLPSLSGVPPTTFVLIGTGMLAICAMILPGISGSLIMVILGQYENVIAAIKERDFTSLIALATGAVVGLAIFSRLLSWLLRNHHSGVIAALVGVMLGSLRRVWPWQDKIGEELYTNALPDVNVTLLASTALIIAGFILVWQLERMGITKEHVDIDDKEFKHEVRTQHD